MPKYTKIACDLYDIQAQLNEHCVINNDQKSAILTMLNSINRTLFEEVSTLSCMNKKALAMQVSQRKLIRETEEYIESHQGTKISCTITHKVKELNMSLNDTDALISKIKEDLNELKALSVLVFEINHQLEKISSLTQ